MVRYSGITFQVRVSDYQKGARWYASLLGHEADYLPHDDFDNTPGFSEWELIEGSNCWLQVAEGEPSKGNGPLRLGVDDIEKTMDRIAGIMEGNRAEIYTTPDGKVKYCTFEDPFGNRIGFFEE